jgi:NADH dehydrogenase [ubiquinone] 1 alpha subcomplex assembly factor 1
VGESASGRLKRSGFAGVTARAPGGDDYLDLDDYHSLVFRVRGDGRKYLANIRTDNWVVGETGQDVWQAFLFARAGEWSEVEVPLDRFLLTWRGKFVEQRVEMNPARVTGVGVSLAGGEELQAEGPYSLGVEWIAARNNAVVVGGGGGGGNGGEEGEEREREGGGRREA